MDENNLELEVDINSLLSVSTVHGNGVGIFTGDNTEYVAFDYLLSIQIENTEDTKWKVSIKRPNPFYQMEDIKVPKKNILFLANMKFEVMEAYIEYLRIHLGISIKIKGYDDVKTAIRKTLHKDKILH